MMTTITSLLLYATMIALWVAFLLMLAYKLGIVEWLQINGNKFFSEMAHCDFCMSWWLGLIVTMLVLGFTGDLHLLVVPFIATPIARKLL
jgi:hypothetical protein